MGRSEWVCPTPLIKGIRAFNPSTYAHSPFIHLTGVSLRIVAPLARTATGSDGDFVRVPSSAGSGRWKPLAPADALP